MTFHVAGYQNKNHESHPDIIVKKGKSAYITIQAVLHIVWSLKCIEQSEFRQEAQSLVNQVMVSITI